MKNSATINFVSGCNFGFKLDLAPWTDPICFCGWREMQMSQKAATETSSFAVTGQHLIRITNCSDPAAVPQLVIPAGPAGGHEGYSQGCFQGHPAALQVISGCAPWQIWQSRYVSVIAPTERHQLYSFAGFSFSFSSCAIFTLV